MKVSTLLAMSALAFPIAAGLPTAARAQSLSSPGVDGLLQALNPKYDAAKGRGIRRLEGGEAPVRLDSDTPRPRAQQLAHAPAADISSARPDTRRDAHVDSAPKGPTCPAPVAANGEQRSADLYVPFESGSDRLTAAAANTLNDLGRALTDPSLADYKFRIEGHTDTVGRPDVNQTLSERRAAKVNEYITSHFGVPPARLTWVGMGQSHLRVPTGEGVAEPCNRRVEVVNLGTK